MVTRIEKRNITSRKLAFLSLLLGISSASLVAAPAGAQFVEGDVPQSAVGELSGTAPVPAPEPGNPSATPEQLDYDQALRELIRTKQHSNAADGWKQRTVPVPKGVDPNAVIQKELIKAPGLLGLESTTPDPQKVTPIKVDAPIKRPPAPQQVSESAPQAVSAPVPQEDEPSAPVPTQTSQVQEESPGGWDWVDNNAKAPQPKPAKSSFTTVFDASKGVGIEKAAPPAAIQVDEPAVSIEPPQVRTPQRPVVTPVRKQAPQSIEQAASEFSNEPEQPAVAQQQAAEEPAADQGEAVEQAAEATEEEAPKSAAEVAKEAVNVYNNAVKLHLSGKLDEAISEYRAALLSNPELSQAHCNLGLIFNQQHKYEAAIGEFRKALAIDPKDAITYNGIGAALRAQKDIEGAIKNWKTAVTLDPRLATAHYNLGTVYEIQKEYDKAVACYREAIQNDGRLGEAYFRLGLILSKKNQTEDAKEQFSKALQVNKNAEYCEEARRRLALLEQGAVTR